MYRVWTYYIEAVGVICMFCIVLLIFLCRIVVISSMSMEPTFRNGDYVLILPYLGILERGDIIVYVDPRNASHPLVVKRIVCLPTETVSITDDILSVRSGDVTKTFPTGTTIGRRDNGSDFSIQLGPEDYLLFGDNRPGSKDGRTQGTIQRHEMYGTPLMILWPIGRWGLVGSW